MNYLKNQCYYPCLTIGGNDTDFVLKNVIL